MFGLERVLRPKSIAAIGGLQAGRVVEQCKLMGYEGARSGPCIRTQPEAEVHGVPAYKSRRADLPGARRTPRLSASTAMLTD